MRRESDPSAATYSSRLLGLQKYTCKSNWKATQLCLSIRAGSHVRLSHPTAGALFLPSFLFLFASFLFPYIN